MYPAFSQGANGQKYENRDLEKYDDTKMKSEDATTEPKKKESALDGFGIILYEVV